MYLLTTYVLLSYMFFVDCILSVARVPLMRSATLEAKEFTHDLFMSVYGKTHDNIVK